jgi:hypothetical protein
MVRLKGEAFDESDRNLLGESFKAAAGRQS